MMAKGCMFSNRQSAWIQRLRLWIFPRSASKIREFIHYELKMFMLLQTNPTIKSRAVTVSRSAIVPAK